MEGNRDVFPSFSSKSGQFKIRPLPSFHSKAAKVDSFRRKSGRLRRIQRPYRGRDHLLLLNLTHYYATTPGRFHFGSDRQNQAPITSAVLAVPSSISWRGLGRSDPRQFETRAKQKERVCLNCVAFSTSSKGARMTAPKKKKC